MHEISSSSDPTRRELFGLSALLGAQFLGLSLTDPRPALAAPGGRVVEKQPWARLEELADGIWAVVSTPFEENDWTTVCNGGLIAGQERVLAIEAFGRAAGAAWLADRARTLTGRWPTDVIVTHFHGDHTNGLEGYAGATRPQVWLTEKTRELIRAGDKRRQASSTALRQDLLDRAVLLDVEDSTELDLGGRAVRIHPRLGHTPSDVTIELRDPSIVFCGDLVWNGLFPNYRDTIPTAFANSIRALRREQDTVYVSGHGSLATGSNLDELLQLVDDIGEIAQRALEQGIPAEEAAATYRLPETVADWVMFDPKYPEMAINAWYRELG